MSHPPSLWSQRVDSDTGRSNPLRHNSTASTSSSIYSTMSSNGFQPSRSSTLSSAASSAYCYSEAGHKRGISETSPTRPTHRQDVFEDRYSAGKGLKSVRESLKPLAQAPNITPPKPSYASEGHHDLMGRKARVQSSYDGNQDYAPKSYKHMKSHLESESYNHSDNVPYSITPTNRSLPYSTSSNGLHGPNLTSPDLSTLKNSSTPYLRTLSKLAQDESSLSIQPTGPAVVGLSGRQQLKRNGSVRPSANAKGVSTAGRSAWTDNNWMEKQRQFLQAYEYLCHIGEAKEWIEDIIHQTLPPIVQLEEALRDGVTLAEIVQSFYPDRSIRIFRHAKLQFRHSDNIALFFRFLADMGLPELFRFELIDLYEKKNIPKVIYCIHALSWLLFRKGLVNFKIGNLVGRLEFEHHELEEMQRGLDKAGVSMPSFAGMGASFGEAPEPPVKVETEEERIAKELAYHEASVMELQTQIRASNVRTRLGGLMEQLWESEESLTKFQAILRGGWGREVTAYRMAMHEAAVHVQSAARGYLQRSKQTESRDHWRANTDALTSLQSMIRSRKPKAEIQSKQHMLQREEPVVAKLQAAVRATKQRRQLQYMEGMLRSQSSLWTTFQARSKGRQHRQTVKSYAQALQKDTPSVIELQALIRAAALRFRSQDIQVALQKEARQIIALQGFVRGLFIRSQIQAQAEQLTEQLHSIRHFQSAARGYSSRWDNTALLGSMALHVKTITALQGLSRAMILRLDIGDLLAQLEAEESSIIQIQAAIRASLVRHRFAEKQRFFQANMEKVVKVQSFVRAKLQGEAYKSLTSGENPPVGTVKNFVHLLNDSDFDFDEEVEFERLRKTVVQHVRQNEMADQYITQLDIKIALLVKNKITLDEVVKHQKHFGGAAGSLLTNKDMSSKDPFDLKALNKHSRQKLEHYQELFFILQTQPQYLARLFRRLREQAIAEKECERVKHLTMGLFGYAQKRREEYYLVKVMTRALNEEIDHTQSMQDYIRGNFFWNRLFGAYIKSPRDRKFMRDLFGPILKEAIIENTHLDLESDPMQIYLSAIEDEELRSGRRSQRNPDIPREAAIRDPETKRIFITHLQDLRDIADQIFMAIDDQLHKMPFGVRYIAQQMHNSLCTRFPHEEKGQILQITGHWVWKSYLQPALTDAEKFGVVDRGLSQEHRRNICEVSKLISQVASGRLFGGENVFLQPLNSYVAESIERMGETWASLINVSGAEAQFDIDEFNDLYSRKKPTLYIKMADVIAIHHLVATEASTICLTRDDMLQEVIRELGSAKHNEHELQGVSNTEMCLTLNPKLHEEEDPDAGIKSLFTETKRCILYIVRVQSGGDLMDIMVKPITMEDEDRWVALIHEELSVNSCSRGAYAEANTVTDIASMSYAELKRTALENILQLERIGRLTRHNHYQDLLNAIAVDIRTKHRRRIQRKRELESVRMTLARLNVQAGYLEGQLNTYNDYIEQAMMTLQNKKGKKRFLMPFTKQWDHERELARSGRVPKFGSFKYSAQDLVNRGILLSWAGYSDRQYQHVDLTISSNEVGVFMIEGSNGPIAMPGASAQIPLDDLLQAQYNNQQVMEFFDGGGVRVNVNLFLHLIMRKFYKDKE